MYIRWFETLSTDDVSIVGGKNASLGEMVRALKEEGIRAPEGFATTVDVYWEFLEKNNLIEKIKSELQKLKNGEKPLEQVGKRIRRLFIGSPFPDYLTKEIVNAYHEVSRRYEMEEADVAVRSSATAEDLPEASFAGQQESYLNVTGENEVLEACRKCYASLFTDRAISYREEKGFDHMKIALSVGIHKMVATTQASAGVMFTIDTESGFRDVVVINAAWGIGENVVQGTITPDEFTVFKPLLDREHVKPIIDKKLGAKEKKLIYAKGGSDTTKNVDTTEKESRSYALNDEEILTLARWASAIEKHYERPMDIEWAKDGETGELFILQARPETVQSQKEASVLKTYRLQEKGKQILSGLSIGQAIAAGKANIIYSPDEMNRFHDGEVLVTGMTDPDWVPIMKRASGIITDYGGRTSHAAIVSRELGIPAVVGTEEGTETIRSGQEITLSCAEGDKGYVYDGILDYEEKEVNLEDIPDTKTRIMMNIASPEASFRWWRLPSNGIGLARMEFIINNIIKIHPMALIRFEEVEDRSAQERIEKLTRGYENKKDYFVDHLARGIAKIAAPHYPEPVIVRMSDFKTNEYAQLIGGQQFEPDEENPMLGWRGASRYYSEGYRQGFALECRAIQQVRDAIGLDNVVIMIPFCRTVEEADRVLEVIKENGLMPHENGLEIYMMCEIPSNILLADQFAQRFDGFSIGTNDLTQLVLGVDRDSATLEHLFDERNEAVTQSVRNLIQTAHQANTKVGICGQAPSDHPDFAEFLVEAGIDSISLNPDSVLEVKKRVAEMENRKRG